MRIRQFKRLGKQLTGKQTTVSNRGIWAALLSMFLSIVLCMSMFPAQAFAANGNSNSGSWKDEVVTSWTESLFPDVDNGSNQFLSRFSFSQGPTISKIEAKSSTRVSLTWSKVDDAQGYEVYRQAYGSYDVTKVATTNKLSYTDKNLTPGKIYIYAVYSLNSSSWLTSRSDIEAVATPPQKTTATVKATFPKGVTIKWKSSKGATSYDVLRSVKGANKFTVAKSTTSTSYLDTSAVGKKYVYKVRPVFSMNSYVCAKADASKGVSSDSGKWKGKGNSKQFVFSNGTVAKGWQLLSGQWRLFSSKGKLVKNSFKRTNGKTYYLDSNGAMKSGWITKNGKKYYVFEDGGIAKGWTTISGKRYYFSKYGVLIKNKYVDGYYVNSNGEQSNTYKTGSSVGDIVDVRSLLPLVNKARKKVGAGTLKWDAGLAEAARKRAVEIKKKFSHTRPNGKSCFTVFPSYLTGAGENIAMGQPTVASVNTAWTNSPGHYANMVRTSFNCFGAACFTVNGVKYWVELFGTK